MVGRCRCDAEADEEGCECRSIVPAITPEYACSGEMGKECSDEQRTTMWLMRDVRTRTE